ncbi:hypothetical protein KIH75_09255 [Bifidobacterium sp. 64T4]|uniref:hypothetical protein n=1 Tax=Bifidobacterium pongonis TaxID=2834432 RepID=UPI001C58FB65|nr:hypothetical protein [Bifidobacterium pongonis]MBW3095510.1 hypothetical protein [Bifidobacterium pongonis]
MRLGGGAFSDEEVWLLSKLPAVANVTHNRITYSDTFKRICTLRYLAGESPTKIFREAGLSPSIIGYKRIERSVARWKAKALQALEDDAAADDPNRDVIARLADRYGETLAAKRKFDDAVDFMPPSEDEERKGPSSAKEVSDLIEPRHDARDNWNGPAHRGRAPMLNAIIAQQARRIDELEQANKALMKRLGV